VELQADHLPPNVVGMFLMSETQGMVIEPPGSYGILCVGGKIIRLQPWFTDGGGNIAFTLNLNDLPQNQSVDVGETWNFQAWYRDKPPIFSSNFTDAVSVEFE